MVRKIFRGRFSLFGAALIIAGSTSCVLAQGAAESVPALRGGGNVEYRIPLKNLPDLVLPSMDPAQGRKYFGTRACVVCHMVNGIGGKAAAALDLDIRPKTIDILGFAARMLRHGAPMRSLQRRLFGEQIDLTSEELGAIIAFLHSPKEQDRFTRDDIPATVRNFMRTEDVTK